VVQRAARTGSRSCATAASMCVEPGGHGLEDGRLEDGLGR